MARPGRKEKSDVVGSGAVVASGPVGTGRGRRVTLVRVSREDTDIVRSFSLRDLYVYLGK